MRIRIRKSIAGLRFSHRPGQVVDWPDRDEARRLIESGIAEAAEAAPADSKAIKAELAEAKQALARSEEELAKVREQLAALEAGAGAKMQAPPLGGPDAKPQESTVSNPPAPTAPASNPPKAPEQRGGKKVERADAKPARGKGGKNAGERATLNR